MSRPFVVATAALIGLVAAGTASAHVIAIPTFLPSGSSKSITFSGPNERDNPMTAFALTVPAGLEIEHAREVDGWDESVDGSTAAWNGGHLAADGEVDFGMTLKADTEPGLVELQAEQRYADGSVVSWPVTLTVTPETKSPSQNLALAGIVALIGVLAIVAIAMLAWRRRSA